MNSQLSAYLSAYYIVRAMRGDDVAEGWLDRILEGGLSDRRVHGTLLVEVLKDAGIPAFHEVFPPRSSCLDLLKKLGNGRCCLVESADPSTKLDAVWGHVTEISATGLEAGYLYPRPRLWSMTYPWQEIWTGHAVITKQTNPAARWEREPGPPWIG